MKYASLVILSTLASCAPNWDHVISSKKNVSITLTDTKHRAGGGGTRAIKFDNKAIKFDSHGTYYSSSQVYKLANPTSTGFTLIYDITLTRTSNSKSERYQGDMTVTYTELATKVLAPDFTLAALPE